MIRLILMLFLLILSQIGICQSENANLFKESEKKFSVDHLKYKVDSIEELLSINWEHVQQLFENNESNKLVSLELEVSIPNASDFPRDVYSFKASDYTINLDRLLNRSKKGMQGIIQTMHKYKR